MNTAQSLQNRVRNTLVSYPDFPKPGILFKDLSPLLLNPELMEEVIRHMAHQWVPLPDIVLGIESRGFILAVLLAQTIKKPFVMARKAGKLPGEVLSQSYQLEYNQSILEIQKGVFKKDQRVLIVDDVLATGGTAAAAAGLVKKSGAQIVGFQFLLTLENLKGLNLLCTFNAPINELIRY